MDRLDPQLKQAESPTTKKKKKIADGKGEGNPGDWRVGMYVQTDGSNAWEQEDLCAPVSAARSPRFPGRKPPKWN